MVTTARARAHLVMNLWMICGSSHQLSLPATANPNNVQHLSQGLLRLETWVASGLGVAAMSGYFMRPALDLASDSHMHLRLCHSIRRDHVDLQPRVCIMFASATRPAKRALNTMDFRIFAAHSTSLMS
ncbi:hypothetical protein BKA81DRAFT_196893 [Phyllosticta paracitricarpa]